MSIYNHSKYRPNIPPQHSYQPPSYRQGYHRPPYQGSNQYSRPSFRSFLSYFQNMIQNYFQGCRDNGCYFHAPIIGNIIDTVSPGSGAVAYKPAIYLYPAEETIVKIKLDDSIEVLIDIPRHRDGIGWQVLAMPDGTLVDLQPNLTNLEDFDCQELGMEFIADVLKNGTYPYIYWDGTQTQQPMPTYTEGWIVEKAFLAEFLEDALLEMQFNLAEKEEFLKFWVPKLTESNDDHFHIYFMQNEDVQNYLPLHITPFPDSFNRILMLVDPSPLNKNPELQIEPQQLKPITRAGFTLVEWGGIICPQTTSLFTTSPQEILMTF